MSSACISALAIISCLLFFVAERYYLIYWPEESSVSVVKAAVVRSDEKDCCVRLGGKDYNGIIAELG